MLKLPKVPNLTDLAYMSVKKHLLDGSITEGSRLTEESLASQLGISKSPVREALTRLESEGLVIIESRRGAYVRRFSVDEIRDLFELRELLEVHAVATLKITPELLEALDASVEQTRLHLASGDIVLHVEEDRNFHGMLATATGNEQFCQVLENVQNKSLLCRSKTYSISGSTAPSSHGRIVAALRQGDRSAAQEAMREHIQFVANGLLAALEPHPELESIPSTDGAANFAEASA